MVEVPSNNATISGALMAMQTSEQVATVIAVGVSFAAGEVVAAGGYMVRRWRRAAHGDDRAPPRLRGHRPLSRAARRARPPSAETLYGMPYTKVGDRPVSFGCYCSPERLMEQPRLAPAL